jgi:hypothetical protein
MEGSYGYVISFGKPTVGGPQYYMFGVRPTTFTVEM